MTINALLKAILFVGYPCLSAGEIETNSSENRWDLEITVPDYDAFDPILNENITIPDNASEIGMWTPLVDWPLVSIHATVLPSGNVVTYGMRK